MRRSRLVLLVSALLLVLAACGSENRTSTSAAQSSSNKSRERNALLGQKDGPYAQCIGKIGCRFGNSQLTSDLFDRQLDMGIRSGDLIGSNLRLLNFGGIHPAMKLSLADLKSATFTDGNFAGSNFMDASLGDSHFLGSTKTAFGVDLTNSNFAFADLDSASFTRADLSRTVMINANLFGVSMTNVRVGGLDLAGATLRGVYSNGLVGQPFLPTGWKLINGRLVGPGARFALSDVVEKLTEATSQYGVPRPSVSKDTYLGNSSTCPRLWSANGVRQDLVEKRIMANDPSTDALAGANLSGMDLRDTDFSDMNLSRTNFEGANLEGASFLGANLTGARFNGASLVDTDVTGARLVQTDFRGAFIRRLRSGCTEVDGTTLSYLQSVQEFAYLLNDFTAKVIAPNGQGTNRQIRYGILLSRDVDLSGKNLAGLNTVKFDLSRADLTGVVSGAVNENMILSPRLADTAALWPEQWSVKNGVLVGPGADLSYTNLSGVSFKGDCQWLKHTRLDGVKTGQVQLASECAMPQGWAFAKGYFVGPKVKLDNVDLSSQKLDGARLVGVSLNKTNLRNASLKGVMGREITGTPQLTAGWYVLNGSLIGESADLTGLQLNLARAPMDLRAGFRNAVFTDSQIAGIPVGSAMPAGYKLFKDGSSTSVLGPDVSPPCFAAVSPSDLRGITLPKGAGVMNGRIVAPGCSLPAGIGTGTVDSLDLSGVSGPGYDLSRATFGKVRGIDVSLKAVPNGWAIRHGILVGPTADLSKTDLSQVDLRGIDLSTANLNLAFGRFVLTDAQTRFPSGWGIVNNYLVGPGADLSSALIVGGDFHRVSLDGANIYGARIYDSHGLDALNIPGASIVEGTVLYDGVDALCSTLTNNELVGYVDVRVSRRTYSFSDHDSSLSGSNQCGL